MSSNQNSQVIQLATTQSGNAVVGNNTSSTAVVNKTTSIVVDEHTVVGNGQTFEYNDFFSGQNTAIDVKINVVGNNDTVKAITVVEVSKLDAPITVDTYIIGDNDVVHVTVIEVVGQQGYLEYCQELGISG